ncbi:hypothetical protein J6590_073399 [Homalodisca vitripennis]|nr:hypothetical protein J6590_073399 [Homalodisca vitripennis]
MHFQKGAVLRKEHTVTTFPTRFHVLKDNPARLVEVGCPENQLRWSGRWEVSANHDRTTGMADNSMCKYRRTFSLTGIHK